MAVAVADWARSARGCLRKFRVEKRKNQEEQRVYEEKEETGWMRWMMKEPH